MSWNVRVPTLILFDFLRNFMYNINIKERKKVYEVFYLYAMCADYS